MIIILHAAWKRKIAVVSVRSMKCKSSNFFCKLTESFRSVFTIYIKVHGRKTERICRAPFTVYRAPDSKNYPAGTRMLRFINYSPLAKRNTHPKSIASKKFAFIVSGRQFNIETFVADGSIN